MTTAVIFTTQLAAAQFRAALEGPLGYPKAGVDIGGGKHAPPAQSVTSCYQTIVHHPTLAQWAYFTDATNTPLLATAAGVLAIATPVPATLDLTWSGATDSNGMVQVP